jgi:multimeric flavodoxin WrbA
MRVIAVNGSPRKSWNTATLLQKALDGAKSVGADTKFIHLYDLNYKGCTSCFACKKKGNKNPGHCVIKDDLTNVLKEILECDALLLGSPIYLSNITGELHSFLERLIFPNISYNVDHSSIFKGKISSCFIYTMNIPEAYMKDRNYEVIFHCNENYLKNLNGTSEFLLSMDTYQFDDYAKYEAAKYDEKHKFLVKTEQYPIDCQKAFDMGARLAFI